jgi:hypothetical protein
MLCIHSCATSAAQGLDIGVANVELINQAKVNNISNLALTRRVTLVRASETSRYSYGKKNFSHLLMIYMCVRLSLCCSAIDSSHMLNTTAIHADRCYHDLPRVQGK